MMNIVLFLAVWGCGAVLALPPAYEAIGRAMSKANQTAGVSLSRPLRPETAPCVCSEKTCGCCQEIKISTLDIDTQACANVTFLSTQIGVSLTLSLDGKVLFKKTVSIKNPEPVCVNIPGNLDAELCVELYNLAVSLADFQGCLRLEGKVYGQTVATVELGCFKIPLQGSTQVVGVMEYVDLSPASIVGDNSGCSCSNDQCECCQHISITELHIDSTVCIEVAYISASVGLSVSLTIDGRVIFKKTISLQDPPPICASLSIGNICIELYNLDISLSNIQGCARLQAEVFGHTVAHVELGCFNIPLRLAMYVQTPEGAVYIGDTSLDGLTQLGYRRVLSPDMMPLKIVLEPYLIDKVKLD